MSNFSVQFKKNIKCYKKVCYSMDNMRQSAHLVVNPIMVNSYGFLFNDGGSGLRLNEGPDKKL